MRSIACVVDSVRISAHKPSVISICHRYLPSSQFSTWDWLISILIQRYQLLIFNSRNNKNSCTVHFRCVKKLMDGTNAMSSDLCIILIKPWVDDDKSTYCPDQLKVDRQSIESLAFAIRHSIRALLGLPGTSTIGVFRLLFRPCAYLSTLCLA